MSRANGPITLTTHRAPLQRQPKKARVEWIDTAKGIAIILVVAGHDLRGLMAAGILPENGITELVDGWIYAFHMPLFFLLSGLFVPHTFTDKEGLKRFLAGKLRTVVYPYFLWSFLTIVLKSFLGQIPNTPRTFLDLPQIVYSPVEQYWFLYALFIIFVLYSLTLWLRTPIWAIFGASALFSAFHVSTGWAILDIALMEAVYFCTGVLVAEPLLDNSERLGSIVFIFIGLAGALAPLVTKEQPIAALAGICFSIVLAHLLFNRTWRLLEMLGRYSLEIFLVHSIVSAGVRVALLHAGITQPSMHLLAGCIAGIFIPTTLGSIARRQFPYLFVLSRPVFRKQLA